MSPNASHRRSVCTQCRPNTHSKVVKAQRHHYFNWMISYRCAWLFGGASTCLGQQFMVPGKGKGSHVDCFIKTESVVDRQRPFPDVPVRLHCCVRADSRFAPSQWETALLCNDVSHWLGASLESALCFSKQTVICDLQSYMTIPGHDTTTLW